MHHLVLNNHFHLLFQHKVAVFQKCLGRWSSPTWCTLHHQLWDLGGPFVHLILFLPSDHCYQQILKVLVGPSAHRILAVPFRLSVLDFLVLLVVLGYLVHLHSELMNHT